MIASLAALALALGGCRSVAPPVLVSPAHLSDAQPATPIDPRLIIDRLHPANNAGGEDFSALNAVGVIAPVDDTVGRIYAAGTGFLIDACHVLTAEHVMYGWRGDYDVPPPVGQQVQFAVGQVEAGETNLSEGLKYFFRGAVTAHGGTGRHGGRSDHSNIDWAIVTLSTNVAQITPLALYPVDPLDESDANWILSQHGVVGMAGFPGDHMDKDPARARQFLWGSFGYVGRVALDSATGYATLTATNPVTAGTSGGVVFTRVATRIVAVGIVQSVFGDGIHDKDTQPTLAVLITPTLLRDIHLAMDAAPCATDMTSTTP